MGSASRWLQSAYAFESRRSLEFFRVDQRGLVTLRYLGKLRHLNVGWRYRGEIVKLYVLDDLVTFATEDGEFIGETRIDPSRDYQPKGDGFKRSPAQVQVFTMS